MLVVFKQSHLLTGEITPRYPIISVILRKHWSWQTTHIKENQIVGNFRISNLQFGGGSREISASSRWILFIKKNGLTRSKLITHYLSVVISQSIFPPSADLNVSRRKQNMFWIVPANIRKLWNVRAQIKLIRHSISRNFNSYGNKKNTAVANYLARPWLIKSAC